MKGKNSKKVVQEASLGSRKKLTTAKLSRNIAKLSKTAVSAATNYMAKKMMNETKKTQGEFILRKVGNKFGFEIKATDGKTTTINPKFILGKKTNKIYSEYKDPATQAMGMMEMAADPKFSDFVEKLPDAVFKGKQPIDIAVMYNNLIKDVHGESRETIAKDREFEKSHVDTKQKFPKKSYAEIRASFIREEKKAKK